MARWLDDEEQQVWRSYLAVSRKLPDAIARETRTPGLSGGYYIMLAMLSEAPGRQLRMSELAELVSSSPSRVSHAVDRLAERGWVRRERSETDRRGSLAVLTEEGMDVVHRSAPQHVNAVRENMFDLISAEELRTMARVFGRLNDNLDTRAATRPRPAGTSDEPC